MTCSWYPPVLLTTSVREPLEAALATTAIPSHVLGLPLTVTDSSSQHPLASGPS